MDSEEMDFEQQILHDLAHHATEQLLVILKRALQLVPEGFETAFLVRVCREVVICTAQTLTFQEWEDLDPQERTQAMLRLLDGTVSKKGVHISNRSYRDHR